MKNIKHILSIFAICLLIVGCESNDDKLTGGNSDSGWIQLDAESSSAFDNQEIVEIPYSLPYGTNFEGLALTYSIELVSGSYPESSLGNFTTAVGSGLNEGVIQFNLQNVGSNYELLFTLVSSSNPDYLIGLSDGSKQTTYTLSVCNVQTSATYLGDAFSTDLGGPAGAVVPPYTVTVTPLEECGTYSLDTSWGPDFVPNVCGGCVAVGQFPNASVLTINSDNSVTIVGDNGSGTGTFDPINDTFTLSIAQELFSSDFNVDVVLTGN